MQVNIKKYRDILEATNDIQTIRNLFFLWMNQGIDKKDLKDIFFEKKGILTKKQFKIELKQMYDVRDFTIKHNLENMDLFDFIQVDKNMDMELINSDNYTTYILNYNNPKSIKLLGVSQLDIYDDLANIKSFDEFKSKIKTMDQRDYSKEIKHWQLEDKLYIQIPKYINKQLVYYVIKINKQLVIIVAAKQILLTKFQLYKRGKHENN
jgi:hypothetical protein